MYQIIKNRVNSFFAYMFRSSIKPISKRKAPAFWFRQEKKKPARRKIQRGEADGATYDRRKLKDLLSDLDGVFADIGRMTPSGGRSIQGAIKAFGPFVIGRNETHEKMFHAAKLDGVEAYGYPTVISSFIPSMADSDKGGDNDPVKHYFVGVKVKKLPWFSSSKSFIFYECALVYCLETDKRPYSAYFYMCINPKTGAFWPVKTPMQTTRVIGSQRSSNATYLSGVSWDIPDLRGDYGLNIGEDVADHLKKRFALSWSASVMREYGANIRVTKGKHKVTFLVPENQWKYFFSERLGETTSSGNKKAIFHAVVAHGRKTAGGTSYVKTHYRGERVFKWGGYSIEIILPGKHRPAASRLNVPAHIVKDGSAEDERGLTYSQVAKMVDKLGVG